MPNTSVARPPTCKCGGHYHSTLNRRLYCVWCGKGKIFKRRRRVMVMRASEDMAYIRFCGGKYE